MDFMHDQLQDGQSFRLFNVIGDFNREGLEVGADFSLPSERVIRSLEQIVEWRDKPITIHCDYGPEYVVQGQELGEETRSPARIHPAGQAPEKGLY